MQTVKNLTNSPYDIKLKGGKTERLPARGEIGPVEIDPLHLPFYRAIAYFRITESEKVADKKQEQHKIYPEDELKAMRKKYKQVVGKKPFNGWDAETLQHKMDEALSKDS